MSETFMLPMVNLALNENGGLYSNEPIKTAKDAVNLVADYLKDLYRETICVICFDKGGRPICVGLMAIGADYEVTCDHRYIIQLALLSGSSSIMLMHNHPTREKTGKDLAASVSDIKFAEQVIRSCGFFMIGVVDSLIVNGMEKDGKWTPAIYSMRKSEMRFIRALDRDMTKRVKERINLVVPSNALYWGEPDQYLLHKNGFDADLSKYKKTPMFYANRPENMKQIVEDINSLEEEPDR